MEPFRRMFTKEAFQDNNFGDGMFKGTADADDEVIDKSDLTKGDRRSYLVLRRSIMIEFRKQYKATKISLDELAVNALEGFDDIVGNTVTPSTCSNAYCQEKPKGTNTDINSNGEPQDPDKIFRQYPSFDPVFMKV